MRDIVKHSLKILRFAPQKMGRHTTLHDWKSQDPKMSILLKFTYKFRIQPTNMPLRYFLELDRLIIKVGFKLE